MLPFILNCHSGTKRKFKLCRPSVHKWLVMFSDIINDIPCNTGYFLGFVLFRIVEHHTKLIFEVGSSYKNCPLYDAIEQIGHIFVPFFHRKSDLIKFSIQTRSPNTSQSHRKSLVPNQFNLNHCRAISIVTPLKVNFSGLKLPR